MESALFGVSTKRDRDEVSAEDIGDAEDDESMTPAQRKDKRRWLRVTALAARGDFKQIRKESPALLIRNYRALHEYHRDFGTRPQSNDVFCGVWIKGRVNMGKTYLVEQFAADEDCFFKSQTHWWDHYSNQPYVVIDEMAPANAKKLTVDLKLWTGKLPFTAETKGGSKVIRPEAIVVTSNWSINEIWSDETDRAALHKRFIEIEMPYPGAYEAEDLKTMIVDREVPPCRPFRYIDVSSKPAHIRDRERIAKEEEEAALLAVGFHPSPPVPISLALVLTRRIIHL